ncbi:hypothetical protein Ddc_16962 [Ditylenchus destructor]|nr:hypothetical protein Ddc_16962 [Ditylenchus destructor]
MLVLLFIKRRHELAPLFLINLCNWMIGNVLMSGYLIYIAVNWRGDSTRNSKSMMFWFGTPVYAVTASLSVGVAFVTWDRCLILLAPTSYNKYRLSLVRACIGFEIAATGGMFCWLGWDRPPSDIITGLHLECLQCEVVDPLQVKLTGIL